MLDIINLMKIEETKIKDVNWFRWADVEISGVRHAIYSFNFNRSYFHFINKLISKVINLAKFYKKQKYLN